MRTAPERPGRLPVEPDQLIDLFRTVVLALDEGRISDAVEPVRRLRSYGLSLSYFPRKQGPRNPAAAGGRGKR